MLFFQLETNNNMYEFVNSKVSNIACSYY